MNEIERIADQLERAFRGDPWYGSSLNTVLERIDAGGAARRVIPDAHTIWEIVLHLTGWQREVARRVRDGVARTPDAGDWPPAPEPSDAAWAAAREGLEASHTEIMNALKSFDAARLDERVGDERDRPLGSGVSYYVTLHGLVQHNVAHTAQVSLLAKGLTPRP